MFGNYVIQKCLEYGSTDHIQQLFQEIQGNILEMTKHIYGCRVVQKFIEVLSLEGQKEILSELEHSILEWIYDLYGNHVVQKLIEKVPYQEIDFIQRHVEERWKELCMHTYGCRVIQRILENCPKQWTDPVYDDVINYVSELSQDQFGNYVIQLILEKGARPEDKKAICHSLIGDVRILSIHKYASNVVEKCIEHWEPEDKQLIIQELLGEKIGVSDQKSEHLSLYKMMDNKYGNYVVQKALEEASSEQRHMFNTKIKSSELIKTQPSNYIKHVINCLDTLCLQ